MSRYSKVRRSYAVELCETYERSAADAISKLGYPSRETSRCSIASGWRNGALVLFEM